MDTLLSFAFIGTFIEILMEYFGSVSAATLKENFDVVYQVIPTLFAYFNISSQSLCAAARRNPRRRRSPIDNLSERAARYCLATFATQQAAKCHRR